MRSSCYHVLTEALPRWHFRDKRCVSAELPAGPRSRGHFGTGLGFCPEHRLGAVLYQLPTRPRSQRLRVPRSGDLPPTVAAIAQSLSLSCLHIVLPMAQSTPDRPGPSGHRLRVNSTNKHRAGRAEPCGLRMLPGPELGSPRAFQCVTVMCSLRGAVHVERLVKPHVLLSQSRYAFRTSCVPIIFYCPVTEHSYSLATLLVWPFFLHFPGDVPGHGF